MRRLVEWLHSFGKYVDYAILGTEPPKLIKIVEKWGAAFDEEYWYWIGGRKAHYLKRAPLWMYGQKRVAAEKYRAVEAEKIK